jgi:hypothetical protein
VRRLLLLLLATPLLAQARFFHNKLEHTNFWIADREDLFPNYLTTGGNVAGDALWKVLPREILERANDHQVSGYKIAISVDNTFTGTFPRIVRLPALQMTRTRIQSLGGQDHEVPDLSQPVGPLYDPITIFLQQDNSWVVEVLFDPNLINPKHNRLQPVPGLVNGQRAGLALVILGTAGDRRSPATPGIVLQASHAERHYLPGRPSYSGSYNAATQTLSVYGQPNQPSATGEIYAALRFQTPTLQIFSDSSGGVVDDPQGWETHLGPGAYATDLATRVRPGFFGLYLQGVQYHNPTGPPTHRAFPFVVSLSPNGPTANLPLGNVTMRVDPAALGSANFLVSAGLHGSLALYPKQGQAGWDEDQPGVYASPRVRIVPDPALIGLTLWVQGFITDNALNFVDTTNVVRLVLN